ncbi:MAG TPA: purine-nucleoside phosphorylase [Gemmatimonadaceae bacterium]|nr:purine-nucleoside phosphorylase [Gemmatimonadaceae bacterium]
MNGDFSVAGAKRTADAIRERIGAAEPEIAIILGSGLGGLADEIENAARVPFSDIPGFPEPTVLGHAGALVAGRLGGRAVIALAGRFHMYEGHPVSLAGFPVRVMHALGAKTLFVSNAAGAIRRDLVPGDLMIIEDHLNLTFANPLTGPVQEGEERFPDMSEPYDARLRAALRAAADKLGVALKEGVYACLPGPSFETRAEVRMLERLGADAVGMSTVPEVIVARANGMRVAGVSCITNAASGTSEFPVLHADVLDVTARSATTFQSLVRSFVTDLPRAK